MGKRLSNLHTLLFILTVLSITSGCGTVAGRVEINRPDLLDKNKKIFIYGDNFYNNPVEIKKDVSDNFIKLGFTVTEDKSSSDLFVDYHWEMHNGQRLLMRFYISDTITKEVVLKSEFIFIPIIFCNHEQLISSMFKKIEDKLPKKPNPSSVTP